MLCTFSREHVIWNQSSNAEFLFSPLRLMSNCTLRTAQIYADATLWPGWYVRREAATQGSSVLWGMVSGAVMIDLEFVNSGVASKSPHSVGSSWAWNLSYLTVGCSPVMRPVCSGTSTTMDLKNCHRDGLSVSIQEGMVKVTTNDFDGNKLKQFWNFPVFVLADFCIPQVNGHFVSLPYTLSSGVSLSSGVNQDKSEVIVILRDTGMEFELEMEIGFSMVRVKVPLWYSGQFCVLCGNLNDLHSHSSVNSWVLPDFPGW